jgi:REP element-mobilizing transposase RayT
LCPKYRRGVLGGQIEERLKQLVREVVEEKGAWLVALDVMPDHVHLLVEVDHRLRASRAVPRKHRVRAIGCVGVAPAEKVEISRSRRGQGGDRFVRRASAAAYRPLQVHCGHHRAHELRRTAFANGAEEAIIGHSAVPARYVPQRVIVSAALPW